MDWLRGIADDFRGHNPFIERLLVVGCCLYPAYDWDMQGRKQERTCVPVVGHILHAILKTGALHIALGNEPDRSGVHAVSGLSGWQWHC